VCLCVFLCVCLGVCVCVCVCVTQNKFLSSSFSPSIHQVNSSSGVCLSSPAAAADRSLLRMGLWRHRQTWGRSLLIQVHHLPILSSFILLLRHLSMISHFCHQAGDTGLRGGGERDSAEALYPLYPYSPTQQSTSLKIQRTKNLVQIQTFRWSAWV